MPGTLHLVSTPIGNPEDLSYRAVRILRDVHFIAAESPQVTRQLLNHYAVETPLTTYHQLNKEEKTSLILKRLQDGDHAALVCDAGTPVIADPGAFLIAKALAAGIRVSPIPGASALMAALSASGLRCDEFAFLGIFAKRSATTRRLLAELGEATRTVVLFIPPKHVLSALELFRPVLGKRRLAVANNLTTLNEVILRGTVGELLQMLGSRSLEGEVTLIIEGKRRKSSGAQAKRRP